MAHTGTPRRFRGHPAFVTRPERLTHGRLKCSIGGVNTDERIAAATGKLASTEEGTVARAEVLDELEGAVIDHLAELGELGFASLLSPLATREAIRNDVAILRIVRRERALCFESLTAAQGAQ